MQLPKSIFIGSNNQRASCKARFFYIFYPFQSKINVTKVIMQAVIARVKVRVSCVGIHQVRFIEPVLAEKGSYAFVCRAFDCERLRLQA
jgi:hypothetical protein